MDNKIKRILVEVEPVREFPNTIKLKTKTQIIGKPDFVTEKLFDADEFKSFFDQIFDDAKNIIKNSILKG